MIKVEIEQDAQVPEIRWLKASYNNGAAWSLIEIRSNEDALQIISALQQSVQRTAESEEPLRDDEFQSWHDDPGYY